MISSLPVDLGAVHLFTILLVSAAWFIGYALGRSTRACAPTRVEYRYIPRPLTEEDMNSEAQKVYDQIVQQRIITLEADTPVKREQPSAELPSYASSIASQALSLWDKLYTKGD